MQRIIPRLGLLVLAALCGAGVGLCLVARDFDGARLWGLATLGWFVAFICEVHRGETDRQLTNERIRRRLLQETQNPPTVEKAFARRYGVP